MPAAFISSRYETMGKQTQHKNSHRILKCPDRNNTSRGPRCLWLGYLNKDTSPSCFFHVCLSIQTARCLVSGGPDALGISIDAAQVLRSGLGALTSFPPSPHHFSTTATVAGHQQDEDHNLLTAQVLGLHQLIQTQTTLLREVHSLPKTEGDLVNPSPRTL